MGNRLVRRRRTAIGACVHRLDYRHFRPVCLDPARGLVTLMSPSHPHEDLSTIYDDIVNVAGSTFARAAKKLGSLRIRGQGEPPGTGMEPDCTFYVGDSRQGLLQGAPRGPSGGRSLTDLSRSGTA